jgi:hypothetical protein
MQSCTRAHWLLLALETHRMLHLYVFGKYALFGWAMKQVYIPIKGMTFDKCNNSTPLKPVEQTVIL